MSIRIEFQVEVMRAALKDLAAAEARIKSAQDELAQAEKHLTESVLAYQESNRALVAVVGGTA